MPSTYRPDEFSGYSSKEQTEVALLNMITEFDKVGLKIDKAFRPPGWGINSWLLDWLADNEILLGDTPRMETATDPCHPSWYITPVGNKLLRIAVPDAFSVDEVIEAEGCYIKHFHFTEPNENSISRLENLTDMKDTIRYIQQKWGNQVGWLSYGEMGEHFKRTEKIKYESYSEEKLPIITTKNTNEELTGVTFECSNPKPKKVIIKTRLGSEVPCKILDSGPRTCAIAGSFSSY